MEQSTQFMRLKVSDTTDHAPDSGAGFSVLEAMIAIAILAASFLPLLALQGQFVKSVEALERVDSRLETRNIALQHLSSLNMYKVPEGEIKLTNAGVRWQSVPALPPRFVRSQGGLPSRFEMTLYIVDVTIRHQTGYIDKFTYKGLGWRPLIAITDAL